MVADTHLHAYACFDMTVWFNSLTANLAKHSSGLLAGMLVRGAAGDRSCDELAAAVGDAATAAGFHLKPVETAGMLEFDGAARGKLFLCAGYQVVASERVEVLSLCDGVSAPFKSARAQDIIRESIQRGGVPVLSWAPGKWWGARGRLVEKLLEEFQPGELCLGDSALRPLWLWPEPFIMRRARRAGFRVLAGSDPLPQTGAERDCGSYFSKLVVPADGNVSLEMIKDALRSGQSLGDGGRRFPPWKSFMRLLRHHITPPRARHFPAE